MKKVLHIVLAIIDNPLVWLLLLWFLLYLAFQVREARAQVLININGLDGQKIVNESWSDTNPLAEVPQPVTWRSVVTDNFRWDCFTICVAVGNGVDRSPWSGAVLVSPSWCVVAGHVPGTGQDYVFMTQDGTEVHRSRAWGGHLPGAIHSDYSVMRLNQPITEIEPVKILNDSSILSGGKVAALENDRHINVMSIGYDTINTSISNDQTTTVFSRPVSDGDAIEGGDSGKPAFVFVAGEVGEPNEPVLVMTAFYTAGQVGLPPNNRDYGAGPNPSNTEALESLRAVVATSGEELDLIGDPPSPPDPDPPFPSGSYVLRANGVSSVEVGGSPLILEVP